MFMVITRDREFFALAAQYVQGRECDLKTYDRYSTHTLTSETDERALCLLLITGVHVSAVHF